MFVLRIAKPEQFVDISLLQHLKKEDFFQKWRSVIPTRVEEVPYESCDWPKISGH
jgi:hypothetical protein